MVRAHVKQPTEKKAVKKKRAPNKTKDKAEQSIGTWCCKINGCDRKFAREADLKRHQRTTKLHMQPNSKPVLCSQCDATFTRNDALRRHQKSRHGGIIIDSVDISNSTNAEDDLATEGEGSGVSAPQSRDRSPSARKIGRTRKVSPSIASTTCIPVPTVMAQPEDPGPSTGPQSYYRHAMNAVFVPPCTPNGVLDSATYQPIHIGLPTSATRGSWAPPSWVSENPNTLRSLSSPIAYIPPNSGPYPPGAYYRTPHGQPMIPIHILPPNMQTIPGPSPPNNTSPATSSGSDSSSLESLPDSNIDPSLESILPLARQTSEKPEGEAKEIENMIDDAGFDSAVRKVLQAVLAGAKSTAGTIDPGIPLSHCEATKQADPRRGAISASSSLSRLTSEAHNLGLTTSNDGNGLLDITDKDGVDIDAEGEADPDGEGLPQGPESLQNVTECSTLPDGIKELINEDSLSYASPS